MEPIKTITVDNVEYPIDEFSDKIKGLLSIRGRWVDELDVARNSVIKEEAALRALDTELTQLVSEELKEKKASAEASVMEGVVEATVDTPAA